MLGRRVFNQTWVILENDSAIDEKKSDYKKYMESWDESHLKFVAGDKPTRFLIRQLDSEQKDAIDGLKDRQRMNAIIRCSLRGIENFMVYRADGSSYPISSPSLVDVGQFGQCVNEEWMKEFNPIQSVFTYLAVVCWAFSEPSLPLSRPSAAVPGPVDHASGGMNTSSETGPGAVSNATSSSENAPGAV